MNSPMIVVGLVGLGSCGKGTVAEYLSEKYGFSHLVYSEHVLRPEAVKRGLISPDAPHDEKARKALSVLGVAMREESGMMHVLAVRIAELIKKSSEEGTERFVVDGFRSVEEAEHFRKSFRNFFLVRIEVSPKAAFERRVLQDGGKTKLEDFLERQKMDEKKGLGKVISMADFAIDNNGTVEELYENTDAVMKKILKRTGKS